MNAEAVSSYTGTDSGWGLHVVAVLIVMGALIAMGYWLRGGVERERAEARRPRCPRCDAPLGPPRPLDRGRR